MSYNKVLNSNPFYMKFLNGLDWVALILVVVGALNWGLVGLFDFNLVEYLFEAWPVVMKVVYVLVALAGIYLLFALPAKKSA